MWIFLGWMLIKFCEAVVITSKRGLLKDVPASLGRSYSRLRWLSLGILGIVQVVLIIFPKVGCAHPDSHVKNSPCAELCRGLPFAWHMPCYIDCGASKLIGHLPDSKLHSRQLQQSCRNRNSMRRC